MCVLYFYRFTSPTKYSASLQHRHNLCQLPLRIVRRPSRGNGGAPILAPMAAHLFRRVLTSVCPTPVTPTPHPVHPSHPSHVGSNQPAHCHLSRSNGGAPVPAPIVALPFRQVLMSVCTTPVPPTPHPVHPYHPSHPSINNPMHKSQCLLIQPIRYDPIQSS